MSDSFVRFSKSVEVLLYALFRSTICVAKLLRSTTKAPDEAPKRIITATSGGYDFPKPQIVRIETDATMVVISSGKSGPIRSLVLRVSSGWRIIVKASCELGSLTPGDRRGAAR